MKKILGMMVVVFAVMMISTVVLADESYLEISTPEQFMKALREDGDVKMKLVSDVIYTTTTDKTGNYWIDVGKGTKILDLNGFSAELNAETGSYVTMLRLYTGSNLIVNDSSGTNSGKLFCYGRIDHPGYKGTGYMNGDVKYRNLIAVEGGSLIVNGGTLEAGRSKRIWIQGGMDIDSYEYQLQYALQFGVLGWAIGSRYDGYAYQQVNGNCLSLNGGSITINDGVFLGRGYRKMRVYLDSNASMEMEWEREATIQATKGTLMINGGEFYAKGNANVFDLSKNAFAGGEVTGHIRAGLFDTQNLRVINVPYYSTAIDFGAGMVMGTTKNTQDQYREASNVGSIWLPLEALNTETNTVELDGKMLSPEEWTGKNISYTWQQRKAVTLVVNSTQSRNTFQTKNRGRKNQEIASVNVTGTMAQGMALTPSTLKCTDTGVKSIKTTWYHGGVEMEGDQYAYGGSYRAFVTLTAARGYEFTNQTRFVIMNRYPDETAISEDGRYAYLRTTSYQFECNHSMNEDTSVHYEGSVHFQQCTVCGKKIHEDIHHYDDVQNNGNITTYTCTTCGYSCTEENGRYPLNGIIIDVPVAQVGNKIPTPVVSEEYRTYALVTNFEWHVDAVDGPAINAGNTYEAGKVYYLIVSAKASDKYYFKPNAVMNCSAVASGSNKVEDNVITTTYRIVAHEKATATVYMPAMFPGMKMETWIKGIQSSIGTEPTSNMQISVSKVGEDGYYFVKRNLQGEWSLYNNNGTLQEFFNKTIQSNEEYKLELGFSSGKYYIADNSIEFLSDASYEGYHTEGGETWYTVYVVAKVSSNYISDISVVDVSEPEIGATKDNTFRIANTKAVTPVLGEWNTNSRFEEGKSYTFTAKVEVADGYKLQANVTATVNHEPAQISIAGNEAIITYTFPVLEKLKEVEVIKNDVSENPTENAGPISWVKASSWAEEELNKAKELNLIPETFNGQDLTQNITRREFAHVAVKLFEKIAGTKALVPGTNPFQDTDDVEVLKAYELGITNGTSNNTFSPDSLITREQMATMMARALSKAGIDTTVNLESVTKFADDSEMHDWGKASIYYMSSIEIIKGVGNNQFGVTGNATREQALLISERSASKFAK